MAVNFKAKEAEASLKDGADAKAVGKACLEALAKAGFKDAKILDDEEGGKKGDGK